MPRVTTVQTNFTAGEMSPRLYGRTDIESYNNAAKAMVNTHALVQGGAVRRGGFRYGQATKFSGASTSRLVGFVVSRDVAYFLEFGNLYVRVFLPNLVYTGIELVSPYTSAQLADIDFVQGADTMFIFHQSVPVYRLRRFSASVFDLSAAPFTVPPFDEQGFTPSASLTLSAATVGAARTATAGAASFLPTDVGRVLVSGAGIANIVGYTSTTVVTVDITAAFASTSIVSGGWYLDLSPYAFLIASAKDPVGSVITLKAAATRAATLTLSAKTGAITITASAGVFTGADTGRVLYADSGVVSLTFTDATHCSGTTSSDFLYTSYASGAWGITESAFRSTDVGTYVRANGGLMLITNFIDASSVNAKIMTALTSVVASPPLAWSIEQPVWNATNGYPRTGTLHEQRLWAAGSPRYPQTIWGSRTGLYLDFTKGVSDSDACIFTIASDEVNPISYLASNRNLLVHTYGGEFSMQGGQEKPITPTNVQVKPQSKYGSKGVRPLTIGKESIFLQRAGRKLRALGYEFTIDGYKAPDLTKRADHVTYGGILGMCYQQEPEQLVWAYLTDGTAINCTLDHDENVTAWSPHYTDGAFESVATIPNGSSDQLAVIVRRTINGATVRYVEWQDTTFAPALPGAPSTAYPPVPVATVYGATLDASVTVDNVSGQTVFAGLGHLEAKSVYAIADGAKLGPFTVTAGQITLPRKSYRTLIGLLFTNYVTILTPEIGTGTGSAQGNSMRIGEITLRFLNTFGCQVIDGDGKRVQELSFRNFGSEVLDQPPELFTGLKRIESLGWERGRAEITIMQNEPMPFHLQNVIRKITVND